MLLCADAEAASAALASGALACPSCGTGRLRPWGHGREREIRMGGGQRERLRPRRGLCRSCRATHILLPSWAAPRRADAIGVIARRLPCRRCTARARPGSARSSASPAGTVRGWLRRLRARAGQLLQEATASFGFLVAIIETPEGRDPCPPGPTGSVLGDALTAVAACAYAAIRWHGRPEAGLDGADRPVRPGRRPRPGARELIPPPRPGAPMPSSPRRRPA